jgi:anti-sigma factor RsiW
MDERGTGTMTDDAPLQLDRALYERWRSHGAAAAKPTAELDPMLLAAYLEGRLDEAESSAVEALLATDPAALDDLIDLAGRPTVPEVPSAVVIRDAQALIAVPAAASTIVRFPARELRPANRRLAPWAAWGAVAASLVLISLVGFGLGMQTSRNFNTVSGSGTAIDILDQAGALSGDGIG